ncbi:PUR family DNA/RNA-binding protein [Mediterranea massiliensis]|uniref:PUR family DNA/RNA-binding protein n=1 Tax=Mediterranea massiliensis TaxID=1841865 RepID=A0ABS2E1E7_9BACT|nr:PUR family DNA/RNA-binding protein [Mediterranea massiliensis]MBM6735443.1 PUR family DNA/RNA-binding protein [Mediterranea massiliensis]
MEEEWKKKNGGESNDKEIVFSQAIKAGKRIYYLDVKKNRKDEMFLAITESKKIVSGEGEDSQVSFEKHKIFLYQEDFDKFMNGLEQSIHFIQSQQGYHVAPRYAEKENLQEGTPTAAKDETSASALDDEIKIDIDF